MGKQKYPRNWEKVSRIIRRLANGHCEWCGRACNNLSVHHIGVPFVGRPGDRHDKHDIRRENLAALCYPCHDQADHLSLVREQRKARKIKRAAKRQAHQALGVGTGLVPVAA
jgi:5-methylcytosine-specific restriction endonuclease McrA